MSDKFQTMGINLGILLDDLIDQALMGGRVVSARAMIAGLMTHYLDDIHVFMDRVLSHEIVLREDLVDVLDVPEHLIEKAFAEVWVRGAIEEFQELHLPSDIQAQLNLRYVTRGLSFCEMIPYTQLTPELCMTMVRYDGLSLNRIYDKFQDTAIVTAAVTQNGLALHLVAPRLVTDALCMAAVANNGNALCYVPDGLRSARVCITAVSRSGGALRYVPADIQTKDMVEIAIDQDPAAIRGAAKHLITEDLCLKAVSRMGTALAFIGKEYRSAKVCLAAIGNDPEAIKIVPTEIRKSNEFQDGLAEMAKLQTGLLSDIEDADKEWGVGRSTS